MFKTAAIVGLAIAAAALAFRFTGGDNSRPFVSVGSSTGAATNAISPRGYSDLPAFQFVDQNGNRFAREDLVGSPTLLHFFFSTCNGPCPGVTGALSPLLREFPLLRVISISIDPAHDTPEILLSYANRLGAIPGRWLFLNGPQAQVLALAQLGFGFAVDAESKIHSTSAVLFSEQGELLGSYKPLEKESISALKSELRRLGAGDATPK